MSKLYDELLALKLAAESMPSPDKIGEVLNLISKGTPYEQLFFEKLIDPSWLPILDQYGFFSNLPEANKTDSGALTYPYHLPLFGLARLVSIAPQAVTGILAKLELPENPTVGDQVLRCISTIREPSCIPVLHPVLVKLGETSNPSSWVWILELLKNWIEIGAFNDVLVVTNSYLLALAGATTNTSPLNDMWSVQQVDEIALERLTQDYPLQIATIMFNFLSRFAQKERTSSSLEIKSQDSTVETYFGENTSPAYWLEDFKSKSSYREGEGIIARRLYLAAERIYKNERKTDIDLLDQLLHSNSWKLFHRLRWRLYADFPNLSSERARKEVLERIPYLNRFEFEHCHEFAQLIQVHAKLFEQTFLSIQEVEHFFNVVMSGPVEKFKDTEDDHFKNVFRRKQLWPISSLLRNNQLDAYKVLCSDSGEMSFASYKPFRTGGGVARFVEHILPQVGADLANKSDQALWETLNNWQPPERDFKNAEFWVQEDFGPLAKKFAEIVETQPQRFLPTSKWWENLKRPEPLFETLNRAVERVKKNDNQHAPTDNEWANWFGVAKWITSQPSEQNANARQISGKQLDWYWPRIIVSNFLTVAIQSDHPAVNTYNVELEQLLKALVEAPDSRLQNKENDEFDDWLTIAINSVRGNAIEGILALALRQKNAKEEIQPWIFEFIYSRLNMPEESPAVFAVFGRQLRLFVYLFKENLKKAPNLLFPLDRPSHQKAAIVSHFCYDAPMTGILEVFPDFLNQALSILENVLAETKDENSKPERPDFISQLGVHAAFYYWNNAFQNDKEGEKILDRFFTLARFESRAIVIDQIGRIFEKAPETQDAESEMRFLKVMRLWERRYAQIVKGLDADEKSLADFEGELLQFLDWLNCECFSFDWRFNHVMQAIRHLKKLSNLHNLLNILHEWNEKHPERLNNALLILEVILKTPNDQLRWSIQNKKLKALLARGLDSNNTEIQAQAVVCRDLLLELGLFDFLDVDKKQV